jgi:hypothetical protein
MNHDDEERLRTLFAALKRSDRREAEQAEPAQFHALISNARHGTRTGVLTRRHVAGLAAAAAAIGVLIVSIELRDSATMDNPEMLAAISDWRPASDILLNVPGRQLLAEVPDLKVSTIMVDSFDARSSRQEDR